jgi:hypothetical protein
MITMGGDLQPDCLTDRLLTGLGQPQLNPKGRVRLHRYICLWGASERKLGKGLKSNLKRQKKTREKG